MIAAPPSITTARLVLRKPTVDDAPAIFATYAGDAETTRYMGWPVHTSITYTRAFLEFALNEWTTQGSGTYLIELDGQLIGSTGFHPTSPYRCGTGYIIARPHWGQGYATEACTAMVALGKRFGVPRVDAYCHVDHKASARVLEKSGMVFEGILKKHTIFPQLSKEPQDIRSYAWIG